MTDFTRDVHIADKILFVDGISGAAKSMLFPVLSSFKRVEVQRIEHIYEYLCLLHHFEKIETDAAIALIRIYADLAVHDNMIAREANFRPKDDSSVFNTPYPWRYLRRLFLPDGPVVMERIRKDNPILHIMTHQVLGVSHLAFLAFGNRLRIIEMVRHPLYVLQHWVQQNWGERYGKDPKDVTLWLKYDDRSVPWWAAGWESQYLQLNPLARVVRSLHVITRDIQEAFERLDERQKSQVMLIPFECFVTDPSPFLEKIESFLETEKGSKTPKMLKKQRCPRTLLPGKLDDLRKKYLKETLEPESQELLERMCQDYEAKYEKIGPI